MKKKGFVERVLYGKDKTDFSKDNYPINRFYAFFSLLKTNWLSWIYISLLVTVSFLPLYFLYVAKSAYIIEQSTLIEPSSIATFTMYTDSAFSLISIPLWMLGFIVLSGGVGLIRKMTFKEGYLFWSDFFSFIKTGYKNTLINALVFSIVLNVCTFNIDMMNTDHGLSSVLVYPIVIVSVIIIIINIMVALMNCNLTTVYNLSVKGMYKNSLLLIFAEFFKMFAFTFIFTFPILLAIFAPNFIISIIILCTVLLFLMAMNIEIMFLYSSYVFDKFINMKHAPEIYRKGLKKIDENVRSKKLK